MSAVGVPKGLTTLSSPTDGDSTATSARRRYYSANQMTLAVLGKESLSQLQGTVDGLFKAIPNRGSGSRPSARWLGKVKPFLNNQPLQAFNIVPVQVS